MANPNPYTPSYSFSDWQSANPAKPLPAPMLDNELANIALSLNFTISSLADIRRSDGKLINQIVTFESLDNDLRAGYSGGAVSAWAAVVDFAAGINATPIAPATVVVYQGETYVCTVAHVTTALFQSGNWKKIAARGINGTGSGDMLASLNLSDLASKPQARINLGLGNVDNTSDVDKPISTATQAALDALSALVNDPWAMMPIGIPFPLMTHKGAAAPPTDKAYRYVKLTAGDSYNSGVLSSESVSGSAPLVSATAVVSLLSSPMYGQTLRLWNTEGRIPRPGASIGTLQNDAFQSFTGFVELRKGDTGGSLVGGVGGAVSFNASGGAAARLAGVGVGATLSTDTLTINPASDGARTATETRMKNESVPYYMRIK